ncbi:hypothetical protein P8V03_16380 [Clostridium sp. A1-XYC3]|uniref:Uncharacterized protein n=1 Tax=Clostridium tanneri TaxID=3037988 RepID=A0ABU4JXX2_9CLOT|nr:hypothetical protein [Clostridium sp. A1-XYC3]MDW8802724.1 hypothetical protein [Clostridium sp. A1-XYC3]
MAFNDIVLDNITSPALVKTATGLTWTGDVALSALGVATWDDVASEAGYEILIWVYVNILDINLPLFFLQQSSHLLMVLFSVSVTSKVCLINVPMNFVSNNILKWFYINIFRQLPKLIYI